MTARTLLMSLGIMLICMPFAARAEPQARQRQLAPDIIEKVYPDGRKTIMVGKTELADRTPAPDAQPTEIDPAESKRGFIVYRRDASDQVFRHSAPRPNERTESLIVAVALGEKHHTQFAVYGLQNLGEVTVSAGPLVNAQGQTLPDETVTIRPVRLGLWQNYWNRWYQEAPKLIDAPGSRSAVPAGESRQFWITIDAPESAAPGDYSSTVSVSSAAAGSMSLTLHVRVWPFQLVAGRWWGVYYYPGFNGNTPRDFADMKAHGVNTMLLCPPGNREPMLERQGDRVVVSFPLMDQAMAELKTQGFTGPIAFFPRMLSCRILRMFGRIDGDKFTEMRYYGQQAVRYQAEDFPDDLKPVLIDLYQQMVRHAKEADWREVLWYLVDEPGAAAGHEVELEWAKLEYALFRQACPEQKTLCTAYSQSVLDQIGQVDVRVCDLWRIDAAYVESAHKVNAQVWPIRWLCQYNTYRFPRQFAGLKLDKLGVTGFTEWTYYGAPLYAPYEQLRSKQGCNYAFVNAAGELLSTITWEAVQEGIDDARYVATLRKLIERAAASEQLEQREQGAQAAAALTAILDEIPAGTSQTSEIHLDKLRARLAEQIVQLVQLGVSPTP
jgi:hypothetical protein